MAPLVDLNLPEGILVLVEQGEVALLALKFGVMVPRKGPFRVAMGLARA
jgi:hypothetical protein